MKSFPKIIYVTRSSDFLEFFVETNLKDIAENESDGTEVAVYSLVKTGVVMEEVRKSKVVFE